MPDAQNAGPQGGSDYLRETTRFDPSAVEGRWMDEWLDSQLNTLSQADRAAVEEALRRQVGGT